MNDAAGGYNEECVSFFLRVSTADRGELIYRPFLGSGVRIMRGAGSSIALLKN